MFYSSGADKPLADLFDFSALPSYDQDLQTVMFIQMNMCGRDNRPVIPVLEMSQGIGDFPRMMAVNNGNCPYRLACTDLPLRLN